MLSPLVSRLALDEEHHPAWSRHDCIPGQQLAINPLGEVFICIATTSFVPIGDIWSGLSKDALHQTRQLFVEKKNGNCRGCWAYKYCDMCLAKMHSGKVMNDMYYSTNCDNTRKKISYALQLYVEVMDRAPGAIDHLLAADRFVDEPTVGARGPERPLT